MIKNIIFDFGNIIVKFNEYKLVSEFTDNEEVKRFLIDNVINSDEWVGKGMIDLGILSLEEAANRINEKTNNFSALLIAFSVFDRLRYRYRHNHARHQQL